MATSSASINLLVLILVCMMHCKFILLLITCKCQCGSISGCTAFKLSSNQFGWSSGSIDNVSFFYPLGTAWLLLFLDIIRFWQFHPSTQKASACLSSCWMHQHKYNNVDSILCLYLGNGAHWLFTMPSFWRLGCRLHIHKQFIKNYAALGHCSRDFFNFPSPLYVALWIWMCCMPMALWLSLSCF